MNPEHMPLIVKYLGAGLICLLMVMIGMLMLHSLSRIVIDAYFDIRDNIREKLKASRDA